MRTPITPIRLPLDLKAKIKEQTKNVSRFMIEATKEKLEKINISSHIKKC